MRSLVFSFVHSVVRLAVRSFVRSFSRPEFSSALALLLAVSPRFPRPVVGRTGCYAHNLCVLCLLSVCYLGAEPPGRLGVFSLFSTVALSIPGITWRIKTIVINQVIFVFFVDHVIFQKQTRKKYGRSCHRFSRGCNAHSSDRIVKATRAHGGHPPDRATGRVPNGLSVDPSASIFHAWPADDEWQPLVLEGGRGKIALCRIATTGTKYV